MSSSLRAKLAEVIKEGKIATRKGEESASNKLQRPQASVGGVSAKASSGDSTGGVKEVSAREEKVSTAKKDSVTPVKKPKKSPAKKKATKKS